METPTRRQSLLLGVSLLGACSAPAAKAAPQPAPSGLPPWRQPVLVELYTSQGCSSCPAADQLVRELPQLGLGHDKVIPLTFHVDYWDQLGWRDPFASAAYTERQEWYARSGALRGPDGQTAITGLYTPQMIIGGHVHLSGQRRAAVLAEIRKAGGEPPVVNLTAQASHTGDAVAVTVHLRPLRPLDSDDDWRVVVALTAQRGATPVRAGENGGRTLQEAAIVRALSPRVRFDPASNGAVQITLPRPADLDLANAEITAFLQSERTRAVAGAVVQSL